MRNVEVNKLRVLAVDGTDLHTPTNVDDTDSLYKHIYLDASIQKSRNENEYKALTEMLDRSGFQQALVITDRGYESYNNIAHIQEKRLEVSDKGKAGKYGICDKLDISTTDCYYFKVNLSLTRKQTNEAKSSNNYRFIPTSTNFDYLPPRSRHSEPLQFYAL